MKLGKSPQSMAVDCLGQYTKAFQLFMELTHQIEVIEQKKVNNRTSLRGQTWIRYRVKNGKEFKKKKREKTKSKEEADLSGGREPALFAGADALLAAGQDAGDAVGFGEQGGVDDGEAQAGQDARQAAVEAVGRRQQRHRRHVAQRHAGQNDVHQLPRRRLPNNNNNNNEFLE